MKSIRIENQHLSSGRTLAQLALRTFLIGLALAGIALLLAAISGCTGTDTPGKRYARALSTYTTLKATFNEVATAGQLTDKQIIESEVLWDAGDRQLAILKLDYEQQRPLSDTALDTFDNLIDSIRQWLARTVKARK